MTLNDRVRERLKEEKTRRHISERELQQQTGWSQSKVAQKFSGRTPITLDELEALCFHLSIAPSEAVRDHGLEFCAEMTPVELRFLERFRQLSPDLRSGLMGLIDIHQARLETRGATKKKGR